MTKNKKLKSKAMLGEAIFWLHTVVLVAITVSGLFIVWWGVIILMILVRAQQLIFHGCILTIWEAKEGGIRRGMAYYQLAARRFLGLRFGRTGVHVVFNLHMVLILGVAAYATFYHIRIHI